MSRPCSHNPVLNKLLSWVFSWVMSKRSIVFSVASWSFAPACFSCRALYSSENSSWSRRMVSSAIITSLNRSTSTPAVSGTAISSRVSRRDRWSTLRESALTADRSRLERASCWLLSCNSVENQQAFGLRQRRSRTRMPRRKLESEASDHVRLRRETQMEKASEATHKSGWWGVFGHTAASSFLSKIRLDKLLLYYGSVTN